MKKAVKTVLSLFLCAVMLSALFIPCYASRPNDSKIPVVYVEGYSRTIYDAQGNTVYPYTFPEDILQQLAKTLSPVFAKALLTNNWDDYCDTLYNLAEPIISGAALDSNGEISNGSHIGDWNWEPTHNAVSNGTYDLFSYQFKYDWRLDVCENAEKLNTYIEYVKAATGAQKVNIVGRCLGANLVVAYLTAHKDKNDIHTCVLYCDVCNGASVVSCPMSGQILVEGDAVSRFAEDFLGDDPTMELVKASIQLFNETGNLRLPLAMVNDIYGKVEANIVPRLMHSLFATMPGMWSMVRTEDYEQAKILQFGGEEEKYERLIDKIDNYHNNVQLKMNDTLLECKANGVRMCIIPKYGYQILPFVEDLNEVGDVYVMVSDSSFGATACNVGETFSDEYINEAKAKGTDKYISPDRQVDASTCLFPDNTWFIKNLEHGSFPESVNDIMRAAFTSENELTVWDNPEFTQYMVFNEEDESISPMTEENMNSEHWRSGFFDSIKRFFRSLFAFIKDYIQSKKAA